MEKSLPKAVRTISRNPADAIGLNDRGRVAAGLRADRLRVRMNRIDMPTVRETRVNGERVC